MLFWKSGVADVPRTVWGCLSSRVTASEGTSADPEISSSSKLLLPSIGFWLDTGESSAYVYQEHVEVV